MNDSSRRIKATSVAAFLFMPQFRYSFEGFRHIVPVFMRTLAIIFEQAGLIPSNHPATRYGIEGVKKYRFVDLMGEAWFTLRATNATAQQWGLFISVIMMIALTVASAVTFILNIVFGIGSTAAQAQIFSHPTGMATDLTSVPTVGSATYLFDKVVPDVGAPGSDYAIMLLDKVLRQAAMGRGGTLQNALAPLMQVYNTGIMVIAAIMLFWAVLSIVVDTAKTGQVGGGRHNMVWAPIRIVFALGLLIPLGSSGFSSGQYMVMKLAEWGSNFGSRGWQVYVDGLTRFDLIANIYPDNPSALIASYTRIVTCQVAWNVSTYQQTLTPYTGTSTDPLMVVMKPFSEDTNQAQYTMAFTNGSEGTLCGTITYYYGNDQAAEEYIKKYGSLDALQEFIKGVREAYTYGIFSQYAQARDFGCDLTSRFIFGTGSSPQPTIASGMCPSLGNCGGIAGPSGRDPDDRCHKSMVDSMFVTIYVETLFQLERLREYIDTALTTAKMSERGWAGMGMWYHQISRLNAGMVAITIPQVQIGEGTITQMNPDTEQIKVTQQVLARYNQWWDGLSSARMSPVAPGSYSPPPAPSGSPTTAADSDTMAFDTGRTLVPSSAQRSSGIGASIKDMDESQVVAFFVGQLFGDEKNFFMFDILQESDNSVYPMASLAKAGGEIVSMGVKMLGATVIIPVALSAAANATGFLGRWAPFVSGAIAGVEAVGESFIFPLMGMVAFSLISAGLMLVYYVPLLPFMRVAFSVLTWITSVFEAVIMVPLAALTHLTTEGDGIHGGAGRTAWILWLNVLLRPILTVIGYIGAMLVFNAFVAFFHSAFIGYAVTNFVSGDLMGLFSKIVMTIVYMGVMYTAANTTFKLLDIIPNAMMRWMGGSPDQTFEDTSSEGFVAAAGGMISRAGSGAASGGKIVDAMKKGYRDAKDNSSAPGSGMKST